MMRIGGFEATGDGLEWRQRTDGCATVFGVATALFGLFWAAGGVAGLVRTGTPLGAVFAVMGACMMAFGVAMASARSVVRIDRHEAVIARSAIVKLQTIRVPVRSCTAVAAVRNLVGVPRAPQSASARRYAPTVSVGLLTPQGFVSLATELEDPESDASVNAAVQRLCALTGLPPHDMRRSSSVLLAELKAFRARAIGPILLGVFVLVALVAAASALAVSAFNPSARSAPGASDSAPSASDPPPSPRPRGRRR